MIRYVYGEDLHKFPRLARTMFEDRAAQFKSRHDWDVSVDEDGLERDEYDHDNPLYIIWQNADGTHGGSLRLMPTMGPTMVNDHFTHLTDGVTIKSPLIWECTRFCLAKGARPGVAAALMLAAGHIMEEFGVEHFVGVIFAHMVRVFRRIGSCPEVLGTVGEGREAISVGLWEFTEDTQRAVAKSAGLSIDLSKRWFEMAFGSTMTTEELAAA
ncbi:acyl-homoserine-lactone synthase [Pacificoceanicola onchidii]|uniref:acyl-homoserine-lactone synthase n=1 Tax=Pacificoceanicola onchidii TaxID=2562685 RepID=UPI0010A61F6B|nr:acyl-homoserine-lactone synthase [Pacificoceanicola onchidii]